MKKIFTTLALCAGLSIGAYAQHCALDSTLIQNPSTSTTPGLSPSDTTLPCLVAGQPVNDTIYFINYDSILNPLTHSGYLQIQSVKIDTIVLPSGLCWTSSHGNNTFGKGEKGVLLVSGTVASNVAPGQYKLRIIIDVTIIVLGSPQTIPNQNADNAGLRYEMRVICPNATTCPAFNSTDTTDSFIPYAACVNGINEVANDLSNVSVVPNPFSSAATLSFSSDVEGTYTLKMVNLIGAEVSSKSVNIVHGSNQINIDRNGLSDGIYLMSISNGTHSITRKVIIE